MRIDVTTIHQSIEKSGNQEKDLIHLNKIMLTVNSLFEQWLYTNHNYNMIAYGKLTIDPQYPLISIAPQKKLY